MASSFAWLDYSERERRQVRDVLDLFREQETRDELGIGQIRDAFADLLFPGTTTIMTRARYFLFVPWIYLRLEQNRVPAGRFPARLREEENRLTRILLASGETDGRDRPRGRRPPPAPAQQHLLARSAQLGHPSLSRRAGRVPSLDRLVLRLDRARPGERARTPPRSSTCAATGTAACRRHRPASQTMPRCVSLPLRPPTSASASRAADTTTAEESLLGYLAREGQSTACEFVWMHPLSGDFPPHITRWLVHMRNFSETLHGAALLYNLMLAELDHRHELAVQYRERLSTVERRPGCALRAALHLGPRRLLAPRALQRRPHRPLDRGVRRCLAGHRAGP